jgi:membrane protein
MSLTSFRFREAWNLHGLTAKQLIVQTYERIQKHETIDRAAIVAFYAMLSMVPFLSFLLALCLGERSRVAGQLLALSRQFLPSEAQIIIADQIQRIQESSPVGVLSFSFVVLLWSCSGVFVAIMDSTNAAFGVRDGRPWWKRRLLAVFLTVVESAFLISVLISIVVWPYLLDWLGLSSLEAAAATVVKWIVVVVALLANFAIAYYFGPDLRQEWEWITPGSTLGVLVLAAASLGLQFYFQSWSNSSATYGALAGVVLMMLWLYVAALALLVGAEINGVIHHAAPQDKISG